jgi:hypothetical protein
LLGAPAPVPLAVGYYQSHLLSFVPQQPNAWTVLNTKLLPTRAARDAQRCAVLHCLFCIPI